MAARSAAHGPRFYDGLAEASDRGLIKLLMLRDPAQWNI